MNPKHLTVLVVPLLLAGCYFDWNDKNPPPPPPPLVTEEELLQAIDLRPMPEPPLKTAFLGLSGSLRGPVAQRWAVNTPVYLSAMMPGYPSPPAPAGRITAKGQVEVNLPAQPDLTGAKALTALDFARTYDSFTPCRLDTLKVEAGQEGARLMPMNVMARNPYAVSPSGVGDMVAGASEWRMVTSPPPPYVNVLPYSTLETYRVTENSGQLVYATGDVHLSGELRCAFKHVTRVQDATQYNLRVNLDLRQGWNVIRTRFDATWPSGVMPFHETVLTGDAESFTFTPD